MPLSEETQARILGIYSGRVAPSSGIERHFFRVCRGEASPASAEEREWYRYLQDHLTRKSREEAERLDQEVKTRIAEIHDQSTRLVARYSEDLSRLESLVTRQQQKIQELLSENATLRDQLAAYVPAAERKQTSVKGRFTTCPVCGGDGGAAGQCYKCGGTGWLDA